MDNKHFIIRQDYKVLVRCFTYNQAKYIEDTLNGFAKQETEFPFVCLVMDDCSTDGEQKVITKWLDKECDMSKSEVFDTDLCKTVIVPHHSNANCSFAVCFLKQNLYRQAALKMSLVKEWREHCTYEATCEGDDYWIDSKKLHTQVAYLDSHPEVTLSCTRLYDHVEGEKEMHIHHNYFFDDEENKDKETFEFNQTEAFSHGWFTHLLTYVIRLSALDQDHLRTYRYSRDVHLVYSLLSKGKGVCHRMVSAVYRRNSGGIYSGNDYIGRAKIDVAVYQELYKRTKDKAIYAILKQKCHYLLRFHFFAMPTSIDEWKILFSYAMSNKRDTLTWICDEIRVKLAIGDKIRSLKNIFNHQ